VKTPRLENWAIVYRGDAYTPPEAQLPRVDGTVYDHPTYPDGKGIVTSHIVEVDEDNQIVTTNSGTVYKLGTVEPKYAEFCKSIGRDTKVRFIARPKEVKRKEFANGQVFALKLDDGYLIETTDTFLPYYTKDATTQGTNCLKDNNIGDRNERWMIGVSVMSGCPVRCKFCATGKMKKWRNLTAEEIVAQVRFVLDRNPDFDPKQAKEFKINYTRMGEPFLNIEEVRQAIEMIEKIRPGTHHYISTIGIKGADFSWIKDNITLQISLHSLDETKRNWLIPYTNKMTIEELGQVRTDSALKTTLNMTLVDESDFCIQTLQKHFDKDKFFVKLSPINENAVSKKNDLGKGIIEANNIV
jgi:adenine C2-methylase RlmN of 23S rRNA A2503 and tRNA A37